MTTLLRQTALAAALAVASFGALADPVVIDFNAEGQQAFDNNKTPVKVTNVKGVSFSGAYAWREDMLNIGSPDFDPEVGPGNSSGFLMNRSRTVTGLDIVVSLEDLALAAAAASPSAASSFPNQYFSRISFSLFSAGTPKLTWFDINGREKTKDLTAGSSQLLWSSNNFAEFDPLDQVTKLVFSANGGLFGIDNLSITLTDPGTGGNVPEPAGYALVAMALLAAGAASRRRSS